MANTLSNTVLNRNLDIQNENSSHREKNEAENFINDIKLNRENNPLQVKSKFKKAISNTLDHCVTQGFLMVFTLFALFGDDLRLLSSPKSQEDAFNFMASLCFLIFTVEIILSTISKENYYRSFFFWLDIIATISLIADIGWV